MRRDDDMAARMSDSDERKIKQYSNLYDSYQKSGNQEGMDAAHRAAEEIRSRYGYSGGADGRGRLSLSAPKQTAAQQSKTNWTKVDKDFITNQADLDKIDNFSRLYKIAQDAGNQTLANSYHNAAEQVRAGYGYSGGRYGAEYIPLNQYGTFTKSEKPEYSSRYDDSIRNQLQDILGSSYASWSQGDDYKYLQNQYAQAGQDAMQNTMAQLAARTGGMASSYATTAGQQAYNDYMGQLETAAREMYADEVARQVQNLGLTTDLENMDYSRYLEELNQYNTDNAFDYNRFLDNRNFQYGLDRDEISDQRYEDETMYERVNAQQAQERENAMMAAELLASTGDYSGYQNLLGLTDEQTAALQNAARQIASSGGSKGGSSGGSSSGGNDGADAATSDGIYDLMYQSGVRTEGDAYAWLLENGYSTTQTGKLAEYFSDKIYDGTLGQTQNPFSGAPDKSMKDWIIDRYAPSDDGLSATAKQIAQSEESEEEKARMLYTAYENDEITEEDFKRLSKRFRKN